MAALVAVGEAGTALAAGTAEMVPDSQLRHRARHRRGYPFHVSPVAAFVDRNAVTRRVRLSSARGQSPSLYS